MTRHLNAAGLALLKQYEGLRLEAYRCPAGIWTIGYGWTRPVNGHPVRAGMTITPAHALDLLQVGLTDYENAVALTCPVATDNQFAALVSLAYNIGTGAFKRSSVATWHQARAYARAADAFLSWTRAGGRRWPGLQARREAERRLYLREDHTP